MIDRSELQAKARLVESHRQHLEELQNRIEQITNVINEHQITAEILNRLTLMTDSGQADAHVSIGSGVTLNFHHPHTKQGTAMVDLGSGIFGERKWTEVMEILNSRTTEFLELNETLLTQASRIEEKLTVLAKEFNDAAARLQPQNQETQTETDKSSELPSKEPKAKTKRRSGMFTGELTLDD